MKSVLIHYQEIALKGKNRPWFVARLVRNIRESTRDLDIKEVRVLMGRIELVLGPDATWEQVRDRLALVFGIGNLARAGRAPLDVEAIAKEILNDLGPGNPATFRVSAKRADKRFPLSSPEIEREVGGRIKEARNWTVNLSKPELTIRVEALTHEAFYSFGTVRGAVYRRMMMRIGERIARLHRAQGIVTGDVVGQVASQTLENMATIGSVVTMPVLRPLVGMDKEEITAEAIRLGTYPISIIPDQDCCTLFTPRHPATKAKPHDVERAEADLPIDEIVLQAVAAAE